MILKHKDPRTEDIAEINRLLSLNLSSKHRKLLERELKFINSGNSGESSSAYYLDLEFKDLKNWVLIHDLRIEHRGEVAQIDHLVINRFLECHVLESKNYFYGIKITEDGEFLSYNGNGYEGIPSPVEQNQRHITLLQKAIEDRKLGPTRLGVPIPVTFKNFVLVAPAARIIRPEKGAFDTTNIVKADAYFSRVQKDIDGASVGTVFTSLAKVVGIDTLQEFAEKLVRLHRPGKYNFAARFGIDEAAIQVAPTTTSAEPKDKGDAAIKSSCDRCGTEVDDKVAFYCRINKSKFNGVIVCRSCQQQPVPTPQAEQSAEAQTSKNSCESCNTPVDSKVVFFCRMNKKRFDGKILCRDCQSAGAI